MRHRIVSVFTYEVPLPSAMDLYNVDSLLSELESQLAKHGELSQNDGPIRISDRRYQLNDEDIKRLVDEVTDRLAERMKELLEEFLERHATD